MNKILILSFLYEDNLCLYEFNLLKDHYNKMIEHLCLPMKYYGVRVTNNGLTRIDEKNQIIWLKSEDTEQYDKLLTHKVVDCYKFIENLGIDYDFIIKTNTSFLINLVQLNYILQKNPYHRNYEKEIVTGIRYWQTEYLSFKGNFYSYRGNFAAMHKTIVSDIASNFIIQYNDNNFLYDDIYISEYCSKKGYTVFAIGQLGVTHEHYMTPYDSITQIQDIFKTIGVCIKNYNEKNHNDNTYKNETEENLDKKCIDITVLKIFTKYIEDKFIYDLYDNLITSFHK